jgi:dihydrodipicolinate synthase/N-acetylneuraminate lyase
LRYHQSILVSCEIPWDKDEHLMEAAFREEVRHILRHFNNLYIFGTAGEGYAVDTAAFQRIVEIFYEETRGENVFPQVGVIGFSTACIRERIAYAHKAGFRMFQISLPCWGALNDREMIRFFVDVCGAFPDARFLHYNLMRSKRVLTPEDYRRVADAVPNLAATKNTGTSVLTTAELMRLTPEIQHFFGEAMFPTGCLHGTCSLLSSFGPMLPEPAKQLFEYGRTRQTGRLFEFQKEYLEMVEQVIAPLRRQPLMDGAYDKVLVRLGGVEMPLRLLSPYESFSEETFEECRGILHSKFAKWLAMKFPAE